MSGGFDKSKSCYGCPDRWVRDGHRCHSTCKEYLARRAKSDAIQAKRREAVLAQRDAENLIAEGIRKTQKRKKLRSRGQR